MNIHVKTCEHIQGRGRDEWMGTKQGYLRKVRESMEQGATDEDRKRRVAAFRMIDVNMVLKLSGDAPPRRSTRRLDTAPGSGSSLSSVSEDSGAGAEVSHPGAGGVVAGGQHQSVGCAARTEVVAVPPQGGGGGSAVATVAGEGETVSHSAPGLARGSGQAVAPMLSGVMGSGDEEAPAPVDEGGSQGGVLLCGEGGVSAVATGAGDVTVSHPVSGSARGSGRAVAPMSSVVMGRGEEEAPAPIDEGGSQGGASLCGGSLAAGLAEGGVAGAPEPGRVRPDHLGGG
jgi:hypothetical protein